MSALDIALRLAALAGFLLLIPIAFASFVELLADRGERSHRRRGQMSTSKLPVQIPSIVRPTAEPHRRAA